MSKKPSAAADQGPFRIQVVAERSGVAASTLRAWERRYGVPVPVRTTSSYRLYTARDIEHVRTMRELCERGMSPAEAAKTVLATSPVVAPKVLATDPVDEAKVRILRATETLDAAQLDEELLRLGYAGDAFTLYERVVAPLVVDVGNLWATGSLSVAQEHFLSERLESMLRNALSLARPPQGPEVMMACVTGEQHVLGLLGGALQLAGWGARPLLLGADTPPDAIADALRRRRVALVGLSVARVPEKPKTLFEAYAKAAGDVPWVVGGDAAAEVGAVIEHAGGIVAAPSSTVWHKQVLKVLRAERMDAR